MYTVSLNRRRAERRAALESAWRAEEDPHIIEALAQARVAECLSWPRQPFQSAEARIEHERHENGSTMPGGSAAAAEAEEEEEKAEEEPAEPSVPEPESSVDFSASSRGRRSLG